MRAEVLGMVAATVAAWMLAVGVHGVVAHEPVWPTSLCFSVALFGALAAIIMGTDHR